MGKAVAQYIKEDQELEEDANGLILSEGYVVTELASHRMTLYDALTASGVPNYNEPHSELIDLYCSRKVLKPFAKKGNDVKVVCTFTPSNFSNAVTPIVSFHGTTRSYQTNKHRNGELIKVGYTQRSDHASQANIIGNVEGTKAEGVLNFQFIASRDPSYLLEYLNAINSSPWRSGEKWTWLCCDIQIDKVLYRPGWNVQMSFLYDPDTHIKPAFYRVIGGVIPMDAQDWVPNIDHDGRNGWTNADLNPEMNFNDLGLPKAF